jgi:hypothetical protein
MDGSKRSLTCETESAIADAEALAIADLVIAQKPRSYVAAAKVLALALRRARDEIRHHEARANVAEASLARLGRRGGA